MIATLNGTISQKLADSLIVEIGGVGYLVFVTVDDLGQAKAGEKVKLHIHEQVREDAYNLYGFTAPDTKELFKRLLEVSGVGPKVAMAVLSSAGAQRLRQAIVARDAELLKGIAGVGTKTAQRIIVELAGKLKAQPGEEAASSGDSAYQALVGLGYTPSQAAAAVTKVPASMTGDQDRIKAALAAVVK